MSITLRLLIALSSMLLISTTVLAQSQEVKPHIPSTSTITAAVSSERVRFTALGEVERMRLEVFSSAGDQLFDTGFQPGTIREWNLKDKKGESLPDGSYLCIVTVKDLAGSLRVKQGNILLAAGGASLQPGDESQVDSANKDSGLTAVSGGSEQAMTVLAHDGKDAQVVSTSGGMSFMQGNLFLGTHREMMRLTPEGNLGIGITNPQARLDVDGLIRTSQGIIFPDGSIQFSAARKTFGTASLRAGQAKDKPGEGQGIRPEIAGTGTTGQIPKWQDGPNGVLTDSVITELSGSIGINGPPNPTFKLDVTGHNRFRGSNVSFYLTGAKVGGNEWLFQTIDADGRLRIFENSTGGGEKLSITQSGNVGIGTTNPQVKLDVAGDIQVSGNIAAKYQDVAEWVPTRQQIAVGTVVILASAHTNEVARSTHAYDTHVAGVVSAQPGVILGQGGEGRVLVSTMGRVKVKVDATRRPVKIGDLLVTSDKLGMAMKSLPIKVAGVLIHRPGTIIGKALEPLAKGKGEILVLLGLQ